MSYYDDWKKGNDDCAAGVEHEDGKGEAYDAGYGTRHTLEQARTEESERAGS